MSSPAAHPQSSVPSARTTPGSRKLRAWLTIVVHGVVDMFSFIFVPLLSVLQNKLDLASHQPAVLIAVGALVSGLVQPLVAWISDKRDTRVVGTAGFALSVIAIGLLGYAERFWQLVGLQAIAAAGIGAFHPVAAAAVGQLYQPKRSMGLAWFYAAGMIGGVCGNLLAPEWVGHFSSTPGGVDTGAGLRSLAWLIAPGLAFVLVLGIAIHSTPHRRHDAHERHHARDVALKRAAWIAVIVLYLGNVLKFGIDNAVVALVKQWSDLLAAGQTFGQVSAGGESGAAAALQAASISGPLQAAKQVGMGAGGLVLGFFLARRFERRALIALPLLGAACLAALPSTHGWATQAGMPGLGSAFALLVCALAGVGYGSTVPLTLSIAQRLLPHRTSLASGLLLGGAWGVGSVGAPAAQQIAERVSLQWAFGATAIAAVAAAALAVPLGRMVEAAVEDEGH